jgi:hypothetical protein
MKIFLKSLAALLFLALVLWAIRTDSWDEPGHAEASPESEVSAAGLAEPVGQAGDPAWRTSGLWDDGKAEHCAYRVTWARYGHHYQGRALLILVKEPWAPDLKVKADTPRQNGFDVLKLNHIRDVPTGIYTYHQMASLFTRRDSGALVKIAATSSEACGVSTAHVLDGRLQTRSYFDGQGDRERAWPADALPEDGLPATLRGYVAGEAPATLSVFPSLMAGRFPNLTPVSYQVEKREVPAVTTPEGTFPGVEIRLSSRARLGAGAPPSSLAYTFAREAPYTLLRFEREDGTVYERVKCERIPYWDMHDPGGEAWLPAEVR